MMKRNLSILFIAILTIMIPFQTVAKETKQEEKSKSNIPNSVMNISKENTYPNPAQELPYLQPSELAEELLDSSKEEIENPELIRLLNETNINNAPLAFGYRATIYLGQWPLRYESLETNENWEFQKVNTNQVDNRGGKNQQKLHYVQENEKVVKGGLTTKVPHSGDVKKMMLMHAMENSKLPLSFETVIGKGTKKDQIYNIAPKKLGYLTAFAPAVNEKGKVTYGEVYLELKGNKKRIKIKNVTQQGIGAWIPVQDHLSFTFITTDQPK